MSSSSYLMPIIFSVSLCEIIVMSTLFSWLTIFSTTWGKRHRMHSSPRIIYLQPLRRNKCAPDINWYCSMEGHKVNDLHLWQINPIHMATLQLKSYLQIVRKAAAQHHMHQRNDCLLPSGIADKILKKDPVKRLNYSHILKLTKHYRFQSQPLASYVMNGLFCSTFGYSTTTIIELVSRCTAHSRSSDSHESDGVKWYRGICSLCNHYWMSFLNLNK